jgi:dienelactone hydrolase
MKSIAVGAILFLVNVGLATAEVISHDVEYLVDGKPFHGYIAYDNKNMNKRPGIIVVHEWWGHNEYARKRARMLAQLGYTAFALDMYGAGKLASHPADAGKFASEVKKNMPAAEKRFRAALKLLMDHKTTDAKKMAAVGYCFGGGIVLEMARRGVELDGVVSIHGSLSTANPASKGKVKARVLVLNGEADPYTKPEQISAFKQEMKNAGVDYKFINYPGARHAFTNPAATAVGKKLGTPLEYNKSADIKSWRAMKKFLKNIF